MTNTQPEQPIDLQKQPEVIAFPTHHEAVPPVTVTSPAPNQTIVIGGYAPAPPRGLSIAALVLGLVGLPFFWFPLISLLGVVLGFVGLRSEPAGRGMAIAGIVTGALVIVGYLLVGLFFLLSTLGLFGLAFAGAAGSSY